MSRTIYTRREGDVDVMQSDEYEECGFRAVQTPGFGGRWRLEILMYGVWCGVGFSDTGDAAIWTANGHLIFE